VKQLHIIHYIFIPLKGFFGEEEREGGERTAEKTETHFM
jgi:hypothetical protein